MQYTQQKTKQHERSVLDGLKAIDGLPSDKKSAVERARDSKASTDSSQSVLDGPQCIDRC